MWSSGPENVRARAPVRQGLTRPPAPRIRARVDSACPVRRRPPGVRGGGSRRHGDAARLLSRSGRRLPAAGARIHAFLGWRDAIDGLRNAALFGGLGVVWVVTSPSGRVRAEIWRATLVAFGLSATVEGLQIFSPVRTASIVDVTTNTLGACGGALADRKSVV